MTNLKKTAFEPGEYFLFTSGCYSDYQVHALLRAKQRIVPEELQREFLATLPSDKYISDSDFRDRFLLQKRELFEEIKCGEWNFAEYDLKKSPQYVFG